MSDRYIAELLKKSMVVDKGGDHNRGATLRFDNGLPCCTTTYNFSMETEQKVAMGRRIKEALNATRFLSLQEIIELGQAIEKRRYKEKAGCR